MPLTVAPPPRNGDAAQGNRSAGAPALPAADPVGASTDAPEPSPTLPTSAAIARTVAAGVLLSAGALLAAAALILLIAAMRLAFGGDVRLTFGETSRVLIVSGLAIACAGALAAPLWPWPARRPLTLGVATLLTALWPLSGVAFLAALVAIVIVGLALAYDRLAPGGARATSWPLSVSLVSVAAVAGIAGVALAEARPEHPTPIAAETPAHSGKKAPAGGADASKTPAADDAPSGSGKAPASGSGKAPASGGDTPTGKSKTPATGDDDAPAGKGKAPDDPRIFVAPGLPGSSDKSAAPRTSDLPKSSDTPASSDLPSSGDGVPTASPEPTVKPPSTDGAEAFVRDYYTAIDEQRFDDAWAVLPAGLRAQFGGFDRWKAGYAKTLSNTPSNITTSTKGDRVLVSLELGALEQGCSIARTYSVTWTLGHPAGEWVVTGLRASADGPSPCG